VVRDVLVIKGTDAKANIDDASFFRLLMPSFPAFLLLLAAIPLLTPTFSWTRKLFPSPLPARYPTPAWLRTVSAAAAVLFVLPLIFVAGRPRRAPRKRFTYPFQNVFIPVQSFGLEAQPSGRRSG
jgi:hypothetical protein